MDRLETCPFCGGVAETHACIELENEMARMVYGGKVGVHCTVCGVATAPCDDEETAVKKWNERAGKPEETEYICVDQEHDAWKCAKCGYIENFEADGPAENGWYFCPACGRKITKLVEA